MEIQELLGLKKTCSITLAKQMRNMELIKVVWRGKDKRYLRIYLYDFYKFCLHAFLEHGKD